MAQGKSTDKQTKALILAEAKMLGKTEAANRNSVSVRTIYTWEQELASDNELAELCRQKENYLQFRWVEKIPPAIEDAIAGIRRCAQTSEADGKTIEALNNSLQLLTKMQFAIMSNEQVRNLGADPQTSDS
jgi:hypothetical protein